jgi:hypothetical protein
MVPIIGRKVVRPKVAALAAMVNHRLKNMACRYALAAMRRTWIIAWMPRARNASMVFFVAVLAPAR